MLFFRAWQQRASCEKSDYCWHHHPWGRSIQAFVQSGLLYIAEQWGNATCWGLRSPNLSELQISALPLSCSWLEHLPKALGMVMSALVFCIGLAGDTLGQSSPQRLASYYTLLITSRIRWQDVKTRAAKWNDSSGGRRPVCASEDLSTRWIHIARDPRLLWPACRRKTFITRNIAAASR